MSLRASWRRWALLRGRTHHSGPIVVLGVVQHVLQVLLQVAQQWVVPVGIRVVDRIRLLGLGVLRVFRVMSGGSVQESPQQLVELVIRSDGHICREVVKALLDAEPTTFVLLLGTTLELVR
jgi:hypothetical protein